MDRRYSKLLVLAVAALLAEACSSSPSNNGTGGAGGSSSTGGATGTGGKAATGGATGSGGMTGTGGKVDSGTDTTTSTGGVTGAGGKVDSGADTTTSTGGVTGAGGKVDSGTDTPTDTPVVTDSGVDADPAANEKAMCLTAPFMSLPASSTPFMAAEFCTLYREICNNIQGATVFATEAACEAAYNGYNTDPDAGEGPAGQKGCRSYHLCNAYGANGNTTPQTLSLHCPHATGLGNNDAAGGPCP